MKLTDQPATEAQKKLLKDMNVPFSEDLTKEQGTRLIGSFHKSNDYQKEVLKYFKVEYVKNINQTQAQDLIDEIFSNEENKKRWKNKLDSIKLNENLVVLKFFNIIIPKGITYKVSQDMVDEILEDEEKEKLWYNHLDSIEEEMEKLEDEIQKKEDRKEDIKELHYEFNSHRMYFNCDKIPKKLFVDFVQKLESNNHTFEQINDLDNMDYHFRLLLEMYPELKKVT